MGFTKNFEDRIAIRSLIDSYSDAVFRRDADDWGACWAEDALWSLLGTEVCGRAAIVSFWEQAMSTFRFVAFFSQPGSIEIEGHHATGRVYTHEVIEDLHGSLTRPVGRYDDIYVKSDGAWLFAERRYTMLNGGAA